MKLNVDCTSCGAEDELHSGGHCWRCVLSTTVHRLLTNPTTAQIHPALLPVATALKAMDRPNSGLTWINQPHVTDFLAELAAAPTTSHDALDALPASRTRDYVRGLLVEHGALPRRDELLARFKTWSDQALDRLPEGEHRDIARRFVRWHLLRRMNTAPGEVTRGTFLRSKQTTTVTIDFLNWLTDRGTTLSRLTQSDIDAWQAGGPSTREFASRFLAWATKTSLVDPILRMEPHRRGTAHRLPAAEQSRAVQALAHHDNLTPRDRLAAILVLVLGQQIAHVVRLTWDDATIAEELATITIGAAPIMLPPPLDEPLRQLHAEPGHGQTAAHPDTTWIFRGHSPGQHISAAHLRQRLKTVCSTRAARLSTLSELTKTSPIPVLAEILGYNTATLERHAVAAAATYSRYIATRR
ncbi:Fis family transcriptional regulator [Georgenia satyanarayanai]|uniref:Fis family transcriptional regulator n=1 Tax=Georgenia satyanarayanai TaxID=860221 RepID=UPI00203E1249|nr:Fis family transcriptional regulator [Georgenia satyanarayanai]MCM3659911.1 Fis family transcriptional regulator [Georgenia satyanarayanai]